jgi:DNA-binding CsgD family transcriptional regulator
MMTVLKFEPSRQTAFADLQAGLLGYADRVDELRSPDNVLDELHAVTTQYMPLAVMGAVRLPVISGDWPSIQKGKLAFLHKSVPEGWWEEYQALAQGKFRPMLFLAASSMAMHTWTEIRRIFQPIGIDNWTYDLALKHGMRDGLSCPVGGRWVVAFWSHKELSNIVTRPMRIMIGAAAGFAALRLEQLAGPDPNLVGTRAHLSPRELAVLRLVAGGEQFRKVAEALGLGEETVRSHLKKAQAKLGARNRTQAAVEALRQHLIP